MRRFEKAVLRADGVVVKSNPIHRRTAMLDDGTATDRGMKEAFRIDEAKVAGLCHRSDRFDPLTIMRN
jgi:hypothetical protein